MRKKSYKQVVVRASLSLLY